MKVGPLQNHVAPSPPAGERRPVNAREGGPSQAEPSAKVELSDTVSSLSDSQGDGVFDAAKVERISKAISEGQFRINPEAIADKLIQNARELLGGVGSR